MSYIESLATKHTKRVERAISPVERQTTLEVRSYLKELLQDALKVQPEIGFIKIGMGTAVVSGEYITVYEDGEEMFEAGWQYSKMTYHKPKYAEVKKLLDAVEDYTQALVDDELPDVGDVHP